MTALLVIAALAVLLIGCLRLLQRRRGARGRVRRGGLLVGAVALLLGCVTALAPDASASKPVRIPAPIGNSNIFPAGTACPFILQGDLVGGNQVQTFFDNGRFHATGRHIDRFTNVDTGTSTTLALQGSVDVVPTADGGSILQGSGITVFVFFPGDAGPGNTQTGRTYLFTGNFVATSDPSGAITAFRSAGKSQNVCAMLM
jgi:hypothetical protein